MSKTVRSATSKPSAATTAGGPQGLIYVIGDIHGQVTMLKALLCRLHERLHPEDLLLFLGDYVDRGEDTCAVIDTLLALRAEHESIVFLRGNHEQMMLDAYDHPSSELVPGEGHLIHSEEMLHWLQNGGIEALDSYHIGDYLNWRDGIPQSHWDFIQATELEYVTEQYHFVHAGLLPINESWEGEIYGMDPRLWIREPFLSYRHNFDRRYVIFGHTPQRSGHPLIQRNKMGLDTGAVFGGKLTAAVIDPDVKISRFHPPEFIQVDFAVK